MKNLRHAFVVFLLAVNHYGGGKCLLLHLFSIFSPYCAFCPTIKEPFISQYFFFSKLPIYHDSVSQYAKESSVALTL